MIFKTKHHQYIIISTYILFIFFIALSPQISFADNGKIKGTVFDDKNCNGVRNGGEVGIPGVLITLNPGAKTDTTDHKGKYEFKKIKKGIYTVTESDPDGYCSTTPNIIVVEIKKKHKKKNDHHKERNGHENDDDHHDNNDFGDSRRSISPPAGCCIY